MEDIRDGGRTDEHREDHQQQELVDELLRRLEAFEQAERQLDRIRDQTTNAMQQIREVELDAIRHDGPAAAARFARLPAGRTIEGRLWDIRLDQEALVRIATKVHELAEAYGGTIEIEVTTGGGIDHFRSDNPRFFETDVMPRVVETVLIQYRQAGAPAQCSLLFDASVGRFKDPGAEYSVFGTDVARVASLALELQQLLAFYQGSHVGFSRRLYEERYRPTLFSLGLWIACGLACGATVVLAYLAVYQLLDANVSNFSDSRAASILAVGTVALTMAWTFLGG